MWSRCAVTALTALAVVAGTLPAAAAPPGSTTCIPRGAQACRGHVILGGGWRLPYYRNHPLSGSPTVTRAVVAMHGSYRDARATFEALLDAAQAAGVDDRTLIIAPRLEARADRPADHEPRWTSEGWKRGDGAITPHGLSSFAVMDQVLSRLANRRRFPNLTGIVLAGHSAGAQYVQRYAAGGRGPIRHAGVSITYVVANPSSYLYLSPYRPDQSDQTGRRFAVPSTSCAYDDYKYGLGHRNDYMRGLSDDTIRARYARRRVTYLLGAHDTRHDSMLDVTCAARLEGDNRLQRGTLYYRYMRTYFPRARHDRVVVPGAGHSAHDMYDSAQGRAVLFPPR